MTRPSTHLVLATVFLAAASFSLNAQTDEKAGRPPTPKSTQTVRTKAAPKVALVDINRATKAELKTLPGIQDPQADRIIAGRPYPTKARLVTRNILSAELYEAIKKRIVAKQ